MDLKELLKGIDKGELHVEIDVGSPKLFNLIFFVLKLE